jgi:hypothetical protein
MQDFTLLSVGASFKKHLKKIKNFNSITLSRCQPSAGRRPLVADQPRVDNLRSASTGRRTIGDHWSGPGHGGATRPRPRFTDRRLSACGWPATSGHPSAAGWYLDSIILPISFLIFFLSCLLLFVEVVNSCWLAPAHARLGQILPKIFKHL